jgi:nucleotide-binding universal stress UspA family protein
MSEVVLVVLSGADTASNLLNTAAPLAALTQGAHVNVLAIRRPMASGPLAAEALMSEADAANAAPQAEDERMALLKAAYDDWARSTGNKSADNTVPIARWIKAEGSIDAIVGEMGSRSDLIVCARPGDESRLARQEFSAALFGTDRPVMMIPPGPVGTIGRRVAIAWRDEKRAIRAVIPALRWLAHADAVHVLIGIRDGSARPVLPRVFTEHKISAELHVLRIGGEPFGQTLLDKAHELEIDLLVMGAYAHSPLRELLLGGVTRHMLMHADLPILMRH